MNEKLQLAKDTLDLCRASFKKVDEYARRAMAAVLSKVDENGVDLTPVDVIDGYVPISERHPHQFAPITKIRCVKNHLEVFVQAYEAKGDVWVLKDEGEWVDYDKALVADTWHLVSTIYENLEYAEPYCD